MENKITVRNLNLYYGSFHALKDVNMDIPKNEITAFIGPSGCGKSTFLKSLNRMNDLVEGCKIDRRCPSETGEDIYGDYGCQSSAEAGRHGIPVSPNPFPMSIYDNIAYGPRTHGIHSKRKAGCDRGKVVKAGGNLG